MILPLRLGPFVPLREPSVNLLNLPNLRIIPLLDGPA
jgi:hypothetical protein